LAAVHFALEEGEDVRFAEVNCLEAGSEELCQEENTFLPDYPAFHIYKNEDIEDYYTGDRYWYSKLTSHPGHVH